MSNANKKNSSFPKVYMENLEVVAIVHGHNGLRDILFEVPGNKDVYVWLKIAPKPGSIDVSLYTPEDLMWKVVLESFTFSLDDLPKDDKGRPFLSVYADKENSGITLGAGSKPFVSSERMINLK